MRIQDHSVFWREGRADYLEGNLPNSKQPLKSEAHEDYMNGWLAGKQEKEKKK